MKIRDILFGICLGFGAAAVAEPTTNWLYDAITVGLPQSEIVRHPIDSGRYYLCWTDGLNRYGTAFRRTTLDNQLKSIPRGGRVAVASLMASGTTTTAVWSASDDAVCWPR